MTAHPKRRISRTRRGMRRAHQALKAPTLTVCPQCDERIRPHRVCPNCGYYKGRKIIEAQGAA